MASDDPEFEGKAADIIGLYIKPGGSGPPPRSYLWSTGSSLRLRNLRGMFVLSNAGRSPSWFGPVYRAGQAMNFAA